MGASSVQLPGARFAHAPGWASPSSFDTLWRVNLLQARSARVTSHPATGPKKSTAAPFPSEFSDAELSGDCAGPPTSQGSYGAQAPWGDPEALVRPTTKAPGTGVSPATRRQRSRPPRLGRRPPRMSGPSELRFRVEVGRRKLHSEMECLRRTKLLGAKSTVGGELRHPS